MSGALPSASAAPSGGLPSRLLRGYCPSDGWERRRRTRADRRAVRPGRPVRRSARGRDQRPCAGGPPAGPGQRAARGARRRRGRRRPVRSRARDRAYDALGSHGQATAHAHAAATLERVRPATWRASPSNGPAPWRSWASSQALARARRCRAAPPSGPSTGSARHGSGSVRPRSRLGSTTAVPARWRSGGHDASSAPGSSPRR